MCATYHQQTSPASPQHNIDIFTIPLNKIFTNDTGHFHPRTRSGNQYIMIAFHADTNAVLVRPFSNKHDVHRIATYQDIHARLCNANRKPVVHILDNEASLAFRQAITANSCTFQLVPPHVHHRNAAERAIRTFKDHFLAVLADTTPPRVQALPPRVPPNSPIRDTTLNPTPTTAWQTVPEHTRQGAHTTVDQRIAARTRAHLLAIDPSCNSYSFAALAESTYEESNGTAMPMLDQDTGQLLEHKQLRRHPQHKATWDASYSNELGRLCQGIGHHPQYKHKKRIEGTKNFKLIQYQDIPNQRKGDVTAKSAHKKRTPTAHASPWAATASGILATMGPKLAPWKPSNSFSIVFFPRLPHALHPLTSPTSTLAHHSADQSMPASNSPIFLTTLSKSIASTTLHTMGMSTLKSPKASMASNKPAN
eukprot:CCRYP_001365-RA/>CCRYP_001365-RA protein AED:0.30 eAED:0.30 QI:0/0/0/1/1/1/2/0/421